MASDPDVGQQQRAMRNVALWGALFGVILVAMLVIWAMMPGHVGTLQTNNISDQPGPTATGSANPRAAPSADSGAGNTGTSGNSTRMGSGPPGSATGSPRGSSGNVSGSNPPEGATRSDTTGSSTR